MKNFFGWLRILSIDVVLGGVASGGMVARLTGVEMPVSWWLALPASIWVIYTADHLLDAWRLKDNAHTPRHLFHYRHFKSVFPVWLLLAGCCIFWVPFIVPVEILFLGLGMGILVLIHLVLVRIIGGRVSWLFHKELGVGIIYTGGVWGGPMVMYPETMPSGIWIMLGQFFALALMNLLIFSLYEVEIDEADGHTSFVRAIGRRNTRHLILTLAMVVLVGVVLVWDLHASTVLAVEAVYGLMLMVLCLIAFLPGWFQDNEKYRIWGDGVFLFPLIVWML